MANQKAKLTPEQEKSRLEGLKSISSVLKEISSTTDKNLAAELKILSVEKEFLESVKDSKEFAEGEYDVGNRILVLRQHILERQMKGWDATKSQLKALQEQLQLESEILDKKKKDQEKLEDIKKAWKDVDSQFGGLYAKAKKFSELGFGMTVAIGFFSAIRKIFEVFKELDTAAAEFRIHMGITRDLSAGTEEMARGIAIQYMSLGVSAKNVYDSIRSIADSIGSQYVATKGMVENMSLLAAQAGIATKTSAEFLKTMAMVGRSTMDAQKDMLLFAQRMSAAAGVPLDTVMEDVAAASEASYQFLTRSPIELVKAAVEAKRMGTSLQSAVKTSASLLNFTQNVRDELEASVLVGKAINLQKARELAYHRDIRGLNQEILRIANETNFTQLDPFQQDAVARALGKTSGEIATIVQADRERANLMAHMSDKQKEEYRLYEKMLDASGDQVKDYNKIAKEQLTQMSNQAALNALSLAWKSIFANIGSTILPQIATVLTYTARVVGFIASLIGDINAGFAKLGIVGSFIGKTITGVAAAALLLVGTRGLGRLVAWASGGIGKNISKMFGDFAGGIGKFGKANISKAATNILLLSLSLIPLAIAMKLIQGVNWKSFGIMAASIGLVIAAAALLGAPPVAAVVEVGAAVLLTLGAALILFASGAWIGSKALKNLSDVPLFKIAGGLTALGLASTFIIAGGVALGVASPGIFLFSLALRALAGPAERVGIAMSNLGDGLKKTVESLSTLKDLSFLGTILQLKNLSSTIQELSKSINDMPDIQVEKLKSLAFPSDFTAPDKENKGASSTEDLLGKIKDGIDGLRDDMATGKLKAVMIMDNVAVNNFSNYLGRKLDYIG